MLQNTISSIESRLNSILTNFNRKSNRFFAWLAVSRLDIHPDHIAFVFDVIVERRGNEKDYVVISFVYRWHGSAGRRAFAHMVSHMFPTLSDTETVLSLARKLAKAFYTTP